MKAEFFRCSTSHTTGSATEGWSVSTGGSVGQHCSGLRAQSRDCGKRPWAPVQLLSQETFGGTAGAGPFSVLTPSLSVRVRVIGSSTLALCHLAAGTADAYYQFGLHCWDLAAATVIIREAGGVVMDTSGELGCQTALHPQGCVPGTDPQAQTDILPPFLTDRSGRQWARPEGFSCFLV